MELESFQLIDRIVPPLARAFRNVVPDECFVVCVQAEWRKGKKGEKNRVMFRADFSPEADGLTIPELPPAPRTRSRRWV